ncbi:protein brambleberry-like isoform X2 [Condylostylus longicornis]|uniref:protein brambleberry-like isoform X2 n=1 Tax=Condylostylus longicornis TaxID=2530218 RepID=UPI00244E0354|nr:protein brambleberry-like isoform X2 [Condylostylus longicornis]
MGLRKCYSSFIAVLLYLNMFINFSNGSILDWIWPNRNDIEHSDSSSPVIPFEFSENNDQFIMDISRVLGIRLSDLDFCQQRVILSLKNSCNVLTDEELGKLAISLMNCQHVIEKRSVINCSTKVSLSDCISEMNHDIKVSYGNVLSRTKSVCLSIRQNQFRGMTELTINKLILQVERLRASQSQLEKATLNTIEDISDNQLKLLEKQSDLLNLVNSQRNSIEENLKEMLREKAVLRSGRADLSLFIGKLKSEIVKNLNELNEQNTETKEIFKDFFDDLVKINEVSTRISKQLLDTNVVVENYTKKTNENFEGAVQKLKYLNEVLQNFVNQIDKLKQNFNANVKWIEPILGAGDDYSHRCSILIIHTLYLLLGMICLIFINASTSSRFLLLGIVLINFVCANYDLFNLNLILLLKVLLAILIVNLCNKIKNNYDVIKNLFKLFKLSENRDIPEKNVLETISDTNGYKTLNVAAECNNNEYMDGREEIIVNQNESYASSRQNRLNFRPILEDYDKRSSCNSTPLHTTELSRNDLGRCKAITCKGSRCHFSTLSMYTDFCRIHECFSRDI